MCKWFLPHLILSTEHPVPGVQLDNKDNVNLGWATRSGRRRVEKVEVGEVFGMTDMVTCHGMIAFGNGLSNFLLFLAFG